MTFKEDGLRRGSLMTPASMEPSFEKALAELERILQNLEDGTITLEDSLAQYERGVILLKNCYERLRDAEQRILKVTGVDGEGKPIFEPFEHIPTADRGMEDKQPAAKSKRKNIENPP